MRKWVSSFWKNYKYRFVPWIILNLKPKNVNNSVKNNGVLTKKGVDQHASINGQESIQSGQSTVITTASRVGDSVIVDHVSEGEDKFLPDQLLLDLLVTMFEKLLEYERGMGGMHNNVGGEAKTKKGQEIMHQVFGYSVERRKSQVSEDAGTGVFLASGQAKPGSLIALYPGTVYMPSEPLFFPSLGNPYIFRCSDNVHIDGNDRFLSKSIYKSCAARDKFRVDLPCCDLSWLTPAPFNPLNIGQYVNNRSKSQENNVVYQESQLSFGTSDSAHFSVHLCKYLPNVWGNPENNHHPLRIVPLVAVKPINEGEEILSSYFTMVHANSKR